MSFPPATEMFQFAGFASPTYGFSRRYPIAAGFPHSEIRGSKGRSPSPQLFAACHVLHRLSVPRHPPNALMRLIQNPTSHTESKPPHARPEPRFRQLSTHVLPAWPPPSVPICAHPIGRPPTADNRPTASRIPLHNAKEQKSEVRRRQSEPLPRDLFLSRTLTRNQELAPASHRRHLRLTLIRSLTSGSAPGEPDFASRRLLVEPNGIEPMTSCLQSRRSPS